MHKAQRRTPGFPQRLSLRYLHAEAICSCHKHVHPALGNLELVALFDKGKERRKWCSKGLTDLEQILYVSGAHLGRNLAKINSSECTLRNPPPEDSADIPIHLFATHNLAIGHSRGSLQSCIGGSVMPFLAVAAAA